MKALLTLSEMPENCNECPCKQDDFFIDANHDMHSVIICGVRGYNSTEPDKRPEWCPLKELPEKLTEAADKLDELKKNNVDPNSGWYGWMTDIAYESGWNNCLKEILGTED